MSHIQSGLWTFLFFTLIGPFLAALAAVFALCVLVFWQIAPFAGAEWNFMHSVNETAFTEMVLFAVRTYIWSAIPAFLAGLIFAAMVARGWPVGWAVSGIAGVVGFMISAILMPFEHGGLLTYIALGAGMIAVACWALLVKIRVLHPQH